MKRLVDLVLGLIALEAFGLLAVTRNTGRSLPVARLSNLLAGASLLSALRCALRGPNAGPILASLAVAGAAHAVDLRGRLKRS